MNPWTPFNNTNITIYYYMPTKHIESWGFKWKGQPFQCKITGKWFSEVEAI